MKSVPVWDLPTRIVHWALAGLVFLALLTGENEAGFVFTLHELAGYGILLLIAFRVPWGFLGSPRSRFSDFLCGLQRVKAYTRQLILHLEPPPYVGHNPLGGWMVMLLLLLAFLAATSGLYTGRSDEAHGPLAHIGGLGGAFGAIHEGLGNLLIPLIVMHIFGVLVDWLLTGDNLVRAMIDGRKRLDDFAAARERPLVSPLRAAAVAVAVLLFAAAIVFA